MTCEPRGVATLLWHIDFRRSLYMAQDMAQDASASGMAEPPICRRRVVLTSLLVLAGSILGPRDATAHSRLVKSDPAARAVVTAAPKEVRLWFNEQVEPAFAKIWIASSDAEWRVQRALLSSRGDTSDKRLLVTTLPAELPDGPVVIGFHVLSVDGHTIEDKLTFTIKKPA